MENLHTHIDQEVSKMRTMWREMGLSKKEMDSKITSICQGIKDVLQVNTDKVFAEHALKKHQVQAIMDKIRKSAFASKQTIQRIDQLKGKSFRKQCTMLKTIEEDTKLEVSNVNSTESGKVDEIEASGGDDKSSNNEVETLVARRVTTAANNNMSLLLTKWKGSDEMTWEPPSNLPDDVISTAMSRNVSIIYEQDGSSDNQESDPLICKFCNRKFSSKTNLVRHCKTLHRGDATRKFKCDICQKAFQFKYVLDRHMPIHQENVARMACGVNGCAASFKCMRSRLVHIKAKHTSPTEVKCQICSKSYSSLATLKVHCATKHKDLSITRLLNCGPPRKMMSKRESGQEGQMTRSRTATAGQPPVKYRKKFWELRVRNNRLSKGGKRLVIWSPVTKSHPNPFQRIFTYTLSKYEQQSPFNNGKFIISDLDLLSNCHGSVVGLIDMLFLLNEADDMSDNVLDYYIKKSYSKVDTVQILPVISAEFEEGSDIPRDVELPTICSLPLKDIVLVPLRLQDHFLLVVFDGDFKHAHILNSYKDEIGGEKEYNRRAKALSRIIINEYAGGEVKQTIFTEEECPKQNMRCRYSSKMCGVFVAYYVNEIVKRASNVGFENCLFRRRTPIFPTNWNGAVEMRRNMFLSLLQDVRNNGQKYKFLKTFH